ncbi:MAG: hypothetical protein VCB59_09830, partial [Gammaproteobacteria bacterium]
MRAVAKFAMRSPIAASISAAAYALFALFFAPFMIVSGAIVGLATLRHGVGLGARVTGSALLITGIAYYSLLVTPGVVLLLATWIPLMFAAQILRTTENQGLALSICAICAGFYTVIVRFAVPDVGDHWATRLRTLGNTVKEQGGTFFSDAEIEQISGVMHESTIVVVSLFWICSLLVSRWWQSELYNAGGFGTEFRDLVIPKPLSVVAAIIAGMALVQLSSGEAHGLASDLLVVLVVLFAFQGLALIHHRVNKIGMAKLWLVGFYVLLVLM